MKPVYITTPIYYVNAKPHIGHLYSTVIADSLARYFRICGRETFFTTGTDEHGLKVQQAAEANKMTPKQHCEQHADNYKRLFAKADITYDRFIRTTDLDHIATVRDAWQKLAARNLIVQQKHSGYYSTSDEAFYAPHQVQRGDSVDTQSMYAIETGSKVEYTSENNYMYTLNEFRNDLEAYLRVGNKVIPAIRKRDLMSYITSESYKEAAMLSISRPKTRVNWAIEVPTDSNDTIYVWLDALMNYCTSAQHNKKLWPPDYHIIGKDILKFHAIYWPSFLLGLNLELPEHIVAHGHWTMDGFKMSKSIGNVIDPFALIDKYGVDAVRYYLLGAGSIANDQDFSYSEFVNYTNMDLSDNIGNFISRICNKKFNPTGLYPAPHNLAPHEKEVLEHLYDLPNIVRPLFESVRIDLVIDQLRAATTHLNKYVTEAKPWTLNKDTNRHAELNNILYVSFEGIRIIAILLQPIIPSLATKLLDKFNIPNSHRNIDSINKQDAPYNTPINYTNEVFFRKLVVNLENKQ